ncbi:MAG TPA: AI-2E family transporter [Planctomycetota bacterium]|nr:AI-2E family transporter [Planctomycetota bacterium]
MDPSSAVRPVSSHDTLRNSLLAIIAAILCLIVVYHTRSVVVPMLFAVFLTALIYPLAKKLDRWLPFWASVAAIILGITALATVAGFFLVGAVRGVVSNLPKYSDRIEQVASPLLEYARQHGLHVGAVTTEDDARKLAQFVGRGLTSVGQFLGGLLTTMLLTVFALSEVRQLRGRILRACGVEKGQACIATLNAVSRRVAVFVWTKTWISVVVGVAVGIACYAIGIDFALFWGFLALALNFIPYVGQPLAVAPPILLAFIQFESRAPVVIATIVLVGVQCINAYVLDPLAMRNALRISALFLLASVILWGWLLGMARVVLGTPLSVALVVTCEHVPALRPIAAILAERPDPAGPRAGAA